MGLSVDDDILCVCQIGVYGESLSQLFLLDVEVTPNVLLALVIVADQFIPLLVALAYCSCIPLLLKLNGSTEGMVVVAVVVLAGNDCCFDIDPGNDDEPLLL